MKKTLLALVSLTSLVAYGADDYSQALTRTQEREKFIQQRLRRFGAILGHPDTAHTEGSSNGKEIGVSSIYQIHASAKQLRAGAGKLLYGRVLNRLVVGPEDAPAVIELSEGQGVFSSLKAHGKARQSSTYGRLQIDFQRVTTYAGKSIAIRGRALDELGAYGIEAQVFSGKALAIAGAMASSFIAGLATSQQSQTTNAFGFSQTQPTGKNAILQGLAQTAVDQSKRFIEESTSEKPVLVVEAETPVVVYLDEEVEF
jgi:hypothetical protein